MKKQKPICDIVNEIVEDATLQISRIERSLNRIACGECDTQSHNRINDAFEELKDFAEILSPTSMAKHSSHLVELIQSQGSSMNMSVAQVDYLKSELKQIKQFLAGQQAEFSCISIDDFTDLN